MTNEETEVLRDEIQQVVGEWNEAAGELGVTADHPLVLVDPIQAEEFFRRIALSIAERMFARPRPLICDRMTLFVVILLCGENPRVRWLPGFVPSDAIDAGVDELQKKASAIGQTFTVFSFPSEVDVVHNRRIVITQASSGRGMWKRHASGVLRADRSCVLDEWTDDRPQNQPQTVAALTLAKPPSPTLPN